MYFDDIVLGMSVDTAPAVIEKEKMMAFAGDELTGKATITRLVKRNEKNGLVEVSIDAYNQNGELVLKDVTEAIVKCRPV